MAPKIKKPTCVSKQLQMDSQVQLEEAEPVSIGLNESQILHSEFELSMSIPELNPVQSDIQPMEMDIIHLISVPSTITEMLPCEEPVDESLSLKCKSGADEVSVTISPVSVEKKSGRKRTASKSSKVIMQNINPRCSRSDLINKQVDFNLMSILVAFSAIRLGRKVELKRVAKRNLHMGVVMAAANLGKFSLDEVFDWISHSLQLPEVLDDILMSHLQKYQMLHQLILDLVSTEYLSDWEKLLCNCQFSLSKVTACAEMEVSRAHEDNKIQVLASDPDTLDSMPVGRKVKEEMGLNHILDQLKELMKPEASLMVHQMENYKMEYLAAKSDELIAEENLAMATTQLASCKLDIIKANEELKKVQDTHVAKLAEVSEEFKAELARMEALHLSQIRELSELRNTEKALEQDQINNLILENKSKSEQLDHLLADKCQLQSSLERELQSQLLIQQDQQRLKQTLYKQKEIVCKNLEEQLTMAHTWILQYQQIRNEILDLINDLD